VSEELISGTVIYDNMLGVAEDGTPVTAVEAGSIVVHKAK
jgi:hypothetical protein